MPCLDRLRAEFDADRERQRTIGDCFCATAQSRFDSTGSRFADGSGNGGIEKRLGISGWDEHALPSPGRRMVDVLNQLVDAEAPFLLCERRSAQPITPQGRWQLR